jgi:hypothetical protein
MIDQVYQGEGDYSEELKEAREFVLRQKDKKEAEGEEERKYHDKFFKHFYDKDQDQVV